MSTSGITNNSLSDISNMSGMTFVHINQRFVVNCLLDTVALRYSKTLVLQTTRTDKLAYIVLLSHGQNNGGWRVTIAEF